jgi:S-methylmethionine-dependent homocysteine/selenocysteine methylase
LHIVSYFGDYIGFNGDLVDTRSFSRRINSIDDQDLGGRVESHEALVNLDKAVKRTADDLNTDEQNVLNSLQDSMGGTDLPNEYHASVDGQRNFYLPNELVDSSQPESTPKDTQQDTGQTT